MKATFLQPVERTAYAAGPALQDMRTAESHSLCPLKLSLVGDRITIRAEQYGQADILLADAPTKCTLLAMALTDQNGIPKSEPRDALHIAIATVGGLQYLLTWNFRHIANPNTRGLIARICEDAGYVPPIICSPDELMGT